MANKLYEESAIQDIANAIREKNGSSDTYTVADMGGAVRAISAGGGSGDNNELIGLISRTATAITIPNGTTEIGAYAFYSYGKLKTVTFPTTLTKIGTYAFRSCINLNITEIPAHITTLNNYAFGNCAAITSITFKGTPTSIHSGAFSENTDTLKVINVPWSEGDVANAPWGATGATINYDYNTGE